MKTRSIIPATIAATVIMSVAVALPAQAHDRAASVDCTTASVSLTNYDLAATALIVLDAVTLHEGTFNGRLVQSWPTVGNLEHTFTVTVRSADGSRYNFDFEQTTTGCYVPPVVPVKPADRVSSEETTSLDCAANETVRTVTTTAIGTELVDNVWVELAPVITVEEFRTPAETGACIPPVEPPTTPETPVTDTPPDRLATTGIEDNPVVYLLAVLLLVGGVVLAATNPRRKGKHA